MNKKVKKLPTEAELAFYRSKIETGSFIGKNQLAGVFAALDAARERADKAEAQLSASPALTYPDRELEYDENGEGLWGCSCGRGIFGRTYYTNADNTRWRVECECGVCGPWGIDARDACMDWNFVIAALTGPYPLVELVYRRAIRLAKENNKDTARLEEMLREHIDAYKSAQHF